MPPVLFLDIDGVLTTRDSRREARRRMTYPGRYQQHLAQLDRDLGVRLNTIYKQTNCDVVVSSAWRRVFKLDDLGALLTIAGFSGPVVGRTTTSTVPAGEGSSLVVAPARWREIQMWLQAHEPGVDFCETWLRKVEPTTRFCILDDEKDMGPFFANHVCTSDRHGLQHQHVERAVALLTA